MAWPSDAGLSASDDPEHAHLREPGQDAPVHHGRTSEDLSVATKVLRRDCGGNGRRRRHRDEDSVRGRSSGVCAQFRAAHRPREGLSRSSAGLRPEVSAGTAIRCGCRGKAHQEPYSVEESEYSEGQRSLRARRRLFQRAGHRLVLEAMQGYGRQGQFLGALVGALRGHRLQGRGPRRRSARTGRSTMPRLRRGSRRPSATWGWPARSRTGRAIPTASICRPCRGAASTTSFRRVPRKSACPTCRIAARS